MQGILFVLLSTLKLKIKKVFFGNIRKHQMIMAEMLGIFNLGNLLLHRNKVPATLKGYRGRYFILLDNMIPFQEPATKKCFPVSLGKHAC